MTQNELTYLLTIAECGSISQAAKELYISQPSLSECLSRVEKEMGHLLFSREKGGLTPTGFGLQYLNTARQIKDCYRKMLVELEDYRLLKKGILNFGIPLNLGTYLLPSVLPAFYQSHPDIQVQFQEANSTELTKMLLSGKIDFCIMHYEGQQNAITCDFLSNDPFYLVMPASWNQRYGFPEYRSLSIYDLKALAKEPFLQIASRQKLREVTDSILKQAGIRPEIRYTTKSMETAKRLVAAGMGITFLPYSYLNLFSGTENLACYPIDPVIDTSWRLVIAYCQNQPLSHCSKEFISYILQQIKPNF